MLKTRAGDIIGTGMPDDVDFPDYLTIKDACQIIGGTRPISVPTFYRSRFSSLIEHPCPNTSRVRRGKLLKMLNGEANSK